MVEHCEQFGEYKFKMYVPMELEDGAERQFWVWTHACPAAGAEKTCCKRKNKNSRTAWDKVKAKLWSYQSAEKVKEAVADHLINSAHHYMDPEQAKDLVEEYCLSNVDCLQLQNETAEQRQTFRMWKDAHDDKGKAGGDGNQKHRFDNVASATSAVVGLEDTMTPVMRDVVSTVSGVAGSGTRDSAGGQTFDDDIIEDTLEIVQNLFGDDVVGPLHDNKGRNVGLQVVKKEKKRPLGASDSAKSVKRATTTVTMDLDQLKSQAHVLARSKSLISATATEAHALSFTAASMASLLETQANLLTDCQRDIVRAIGGTVPAKGLEDK